MTGEEMKDVRHSIGDTLGRQLSPADMAKLCGLKEGRHNNGEKRYRQWEQGEDLIPGPVGTLLSLYAAGLNDGWVAGFFIAYIEARLGV